MGLAVRARHTGDSIGTGGGLRDRLRDHSALLIIAGVVLADAIVAGGLLLIGVPPDDTCSPPSCARAVESRSVALAPIAGSEAPDQPAEHRGPVRIAQHPPGRHTR